MELYPSLGKRPGRHLGSAGASVGAPARSDARHAGQGAAFAMTAALQINQGEVRLLVEALSGRWNFEKDRRDQRGVWHYVANAFSLCVDRIAPGAPPLGSPPVVHTWFDPLVLPQRWLRHRIRCLRGRQLVARTS